MFMGTKTSPKVLVLFDLVYVFVSCAHKLHSSGAKHLFHVDVMFVPRTLNYMSQM
jgi:hypothetical protein